MAHYLPALIMFVLTVVVSALMMVPILRWRPTSGAVRLYWVGTWLFFIALASVSGAMNTLSLLDYDVVASVQVLLNGLLVGVVGFVVVGWFHLVGLGLVKGVMAVVRRSRRNA